MSADDQRTAEQELADARPTPYEPDGQGGFQYVDVREYIARCEDMIDRLRAELTEAREERDGFAEQVCTLRRSREVWKDRAERCWTAGDALAAAAAETSGWRGLPSALWAPLADARDAWRSVRDDGPAAVMTEHKVHMFRDPGDPAECGWECLTCHTAQAGFDAMWKAEEDARRHRNAVPTPAVTAAIEAAIAAARGGESS